MWFIEVAVAWDGVGVPAFHRLPRVSGEVTFTPMDYSSADPQTLSASGSCFDASSPTAASLAPCRLPADESTLVTFAGGESDSKVTFNPGNLIPGQTYEVSIDEGAFVGISGTGTPRASAAFSTRFYEAQTVKGCQVGDASAGPLHRSSAIKVTFNGPVHVDDSKAISIGPYATTTVDGVTSGAFTTNYPQSLSGGLRQFQAACYSSVFFRWLGFLKAVASPGRPLVKQFNGMARERWDRSGKPEGLHGGVIQPRVVVSLSKIAEIS